MKKYLAGNVIRCYLRVMKAVQKKETYTYATLPNVRQAAIKKAKKEGMTLSQKIHQLLQEYIRTK